MAVVVSWFAANHARQSALLVGQTVPISLVLFFIAIPIRRQTALSNAHGRFQ